MRTIILGLEGRAQKKEQMKEVHIFFLFFRGITQGNEDAM